MDKQTIDCDIFESKMYNFLTVIESSKEQTTSKPRNQFIGCFDVNRNFFVFGSKAGELHCFRRRQTNSNESYTMHPLIDSAINHVSIIADYLVSFASDFAIYVFDWKTNERHYGWKSTTNAKITAIQTNMDSDDKNLMVITGDSSGIVRRHDITTSGQQTVIFCENGFEIVQIEFIDRVSVIVSTTLRTVILRLDSGDHGLTQIGKNERKTPARYGAVYSAKDDVVYACRPALHLLKADAITGDVIETIRINNSRSNSCDLFSDKIKGDLKTDNINYKLGVLSSFCGDNYLISHNNSQFLIIETNGDYCFKGKIDDLVSIKTPHRNSNEAFLLFKSNDIIQLTNKTWLCSLENNNNDEISDDANVNLNPKFKFRSNSSESLMSLFNPINSKVVSFIGDEVKPVFDKIHSNVAKKFDQLSTSIILSINNNSNHDSEINNLSSNSYEAIEAVEEINASEEAVEELDVSPIVVTRKNKKRHQEKAKNIAENNTDIIDCLSKISIEDEPLLPKISNHENSVPLVSTLRFNDESSDDRLQAILNAYKEANQESKLEDYFDTDLNIDEHFPIENFDVTNDTKENVLPMIQIHNSRIEIESNDSGEKTGDNKSTIIELKWHMFFPPDILVKKIDYNLSLLSLCVYGYNSDKDMGLMWFTGNRANESANCLLYYPYLSELQLPSKASVIHIAASFKDLYILCANGYIYKREGIDACKPLGTKWSNVKLCKSKAKLKSISLNNSEGVIWCCDENGEAWTLIIKNHNWLMINDFSSHSIEFSKICVAFNKQSIVWAIDKRGKIFVRLFNIDGGSWLLVDGILASDLVVCDQYVWIVVERTKLYRRSNVCGINYEVDDWKRVEVPFDSEHDSFQSMSVSDNNEFWILTQKSMVWHSVNDGFEKSKDADLGWFLV